MARWTQCSSSRTVNFIYEPLTCCRFCFILFLLSSTLLFHSNRIILFYHVLLPPCTKWKCRIPTIRLPSSPYGLSNETVRHCLVDLFTSREHGSNVALVNGGYSRPWLYSTMAIFHCDCDRLYARTVVRLVKYLATNCSDRKQTLTHFVTFAGSLNKRRFVLTKLLLNNSSCLTVRGSDFEPVTSTVRERRERL